MSIVYPGKCMQHPRTYVVMMRDRVGCVERIVVVLGFPHVKLNVVTSLLMWEWNGNVVVVAMAKGRTVVCCVELLANAVVVRAEVFPFIFPQLPLPSTQQCLCKLTCACLSCTYEFVSMA